MKKIWKWLWISLCLVAVAVLGWFSYRVYGDVATAQAAADQLREELDAAKAGLADGEMNVFVNEKAEERFSKDEKDAEQSDDLALFVSPEDIRFHSRSKSWTEKKLEALYQELLLNKHGEELNALSDVYVLAEADDYAAASHHTSTFGYDLHLCFPSFPLKDLFSFYREGGVIKLYDGDRRTTPEDMADSLSHEYGHHYTFYYMLKNERGAKTYLGTEYEKLRQIDPERVRAAYLYANDYRENHHWYYYEVAAEDYVVLMGSPNSRTIEDYYDTEESLYGRNNRVEYAKNMSVHENLMIPMPTQVPGLAEYFYSFIDEPAPTYEPKELTLGIKRRSNSYSLSTGHRTFTHYVITWDKVYGEDATYTLVCFDEDDYRASLYPIKTVTEGEEARAVIGALTQEKRGMLYYLEDKHAKGTKTFVVTVILPDGTMYCSEPLEYNF